MFDESLPTLDELAGLSDADLAAAASTWAAASAAAEARKLAVIAEMQGRACAGEVHSRWVVDDLDAAAAALSCALTISHGRALGQIGIAVALRDRLPKVRARFLDGHISIAMISMIMARTYLVLDEVALARIDSEIAERAASWGPLSQFKLQQSIDLCIDRYDPDAVRRVRNSVRTRDFTVGQRDDATGTTSVFGRLSSTDAALLERRISTVIASVCEDDPRTLAQRRADAVGAIAAHSTRLTCRCDNDSCAARSDDGRASSVVIHIIAEKDSLDAKQDRELHGPGFDRPPTPAEGTEPATAQRPRRKSALMPGFRGAVVPAPLLAELIAHGAKVRLVGSPTDDEDSYRPSTALQEFIRTRDLTCRFPGCDRPAVAADIDHTQPWPTGATHPSNLKIYCRLHHLIKTFWDGFDDRQDPDGTVVVTTPSGLCYATKPLCSLLFPQWDTATPAPPERQEAAPRYPGRQLRMPIRRRSREQNRLAGIAAERRLNAAQREVDAGKTAGIRIRSADRSRSPYTFRSADYVPDYGDDPPPF
ncbi:MAG: DUF222 domain-containing protein [Mycolicibacterium sp.]|uniref:HNH endonuclease signature motif containing protein n=1 Tax=Mycolicibacterium sp. TaxID=2320850 RepID=UPI003D0C078E